MFTYVYILICMHIRMYERVYTCSYVRTCVHCMQLCIYIHMHMVKEDDYIPVNNSLLLVIDVF